jgi:hypothetical protein
LKVILEATRLAYWVSDDVDFEVEDEIRIYATLRNLGYMDNIQLRRLIRMLPGDIDEIFWMEYNTGPSIFQLIKSHDSFTY